MAPLDYQDILFRWIVHQHWSVGMLAFAAGVVYAFQGFRVLGFLLSLSNAILGALLGLSIAAVIQFPWPILELTLAAAAAVFGLAKRRPAVIAASAATWGLLGHYLGVQFHLPHYAPLVLMLTLAAFGGLFAMLNYRPMTVVLMALQGTILIVLGFVGVSVTLLPSVGVTFRDWASDQAYVVPVLFGMLFATGYSYQSNAQRGSVISRI